MVSSITDVHIEEIRNGYNPSSGYIDQIEPKKNGFRFGFIGQILEVKGVHTLIEAFQEVKFGRKTRLDIWGDYTINPSYTERLRDFIADSESIYLNGRFEQNKLLDVLSKIDVLVVPSLWYENAPLVIQEAFSANIPVIATNLGGMAEIITHGINWTFV